MSDTGRLDCVPCNTFKHWLEFQLLDNQGKPLIGIPYTLKSRDGVIKANGVTDGQGILREENLSPLPVTLHVDAQKLADQLVEKPSVAAVKTEKASGSSPAIMPGELSDGLPKIKGWTEEALQTKYYADREYAGITVIPEHNRRHVIAVERIAKPVFAKSCLQPAGCTDAGTGMEPHTHFGEMQVYRATPTGQLPASAYPKQEEKSTSWYEWPIRGLFWILDSTTPKAEAFAPGLFGGGAAAGGEIAIAGGEAAAAGADSSSDKNKGYMREARPMLSHSELKKLKNTQMGLSNNYYLMNVSVTVLGVMMRSWWNGSDSDLESHKNLIKIADEKGTVPTRVRYRFVEDVRTEQLIPIGYHTSEGSELEQVKVRHVQYNSSLNQYEFWEDDADSPTLIWYVDPQKGEISQNEISGQYDTSINVKVIPLDPTITSQTPGLPIPEQQTWRDGILVNPPQDLNEIAGNKTETPISDGTDHGPTKTTTPVQERDFRDYILIFPISNIPAIYVYLSCPYGGTEKGKYSGRSYDPTKAGGPIQDLDWRNVEITQEGIDKVKLHTRRFDKSIENQIMIERLEKILAGEITITDYDKRFYTHETRELERYRALGVPDGVNDSITWNNAHTATLEDYKINERVDSLYTPEAIEIASEYEG